MKQKYIKQVDNQNFLYPNNYLAEYDVNIVHNLIENNVSGTTTQPVLTKVGNDINVSVNYTWNLNGAEPFYNNQGALNLISVYFQTPDKQYLNVWVNVYTLQTFALNTTTTGGTMNFTITPAMMNQASFATNGNYSITFNFISRRTVFRKPWLIPLQVLTPTPTPTLTKTPTPTPTINLFNYKVRVCGTGTEYIVKGNLNPVVGHTYKIYAPTCIGSMDGNTCWEIVSTTIDAPDCTGIIFGTDYGSCSDCISLTPTPTPTPSATPSTPIYQAVGVLLKASNVAGICYEVPQTVYTVYGYEITTGTALFTNTALTTPVIGYDYVTQVAGSGEIWQITSGYGVITTSTGLYC